MDVAGIRSKFSAERAHKTQLKLSRQIVFEDRLPKKIRYVAGVDVAYTKNFSIGVVAVLDYTTLEFVESQKNFRRTCFPYIPTLLSFREIPSTVFSVRKLHVQPDVFLIDGHGFAHPYRCGFASHLGLVIGKPTIGVAKNKLLSEVENVKVEEDTVFLKHKGEIIGAAVATKRESKPVYVSVGHMISLKRAVQIVKHCARNNRIPEPILKAHEIATAEKRKINNASTTNN